MGGLLSANKAAAFEFQDGTNFRLNSPFETRLMAVLQANRAARTAPLPTFAKIQMQFGKVSASFGELKAVFAECDKDQSGAIDLSEISGAVAKLVGTGEFSDADVLAIYSAADEDEQGGLSFKENNDAIIEKTELESQDVSESFSEERFKELDRDNSGFITFVEFLHGFLSWVSDMDGGEGEGGGGGGGGEEVEVEVDGDGEEAAAESTE